MTRSTDSAIGRKRYYLTEAELARVLEAAKTRGRHCARDYALCLIVYEHGLRISEALDLRWDMDVDLAAQQLHVKRLKNGLDGVHPMSAELMEALTELRKQYPASDYLFQSERTGRKMYRQNGLRIIGTLGEAAGLRIPLTPHMLRHSCATSLVGRNVNLIVVQRYLGHASIGSTTRYVGLNASQFTGIWGKAS